MTNVKRLGFYAVLGMTFFAPSVTPLAAASSVSGVFGNVVYNQKIDDLRGEEIEIRGNGPNPTAEFIICPGNCLDIYKVEAHVTGNRLTFEYAAPSATPDGAPTMKKYSGVLKGDKLVLTELGVPGAKPQILLRRPERYALDIAVEASTDHGH